MVTVQALHACLRELPCAQCGEPQVAPTWSEHVSERRVRHVWQCDACRYEYETTVYLRAEAA